MRTLDDPIGMAKAMLWEAAKGKLRAMVAVEGAGRSVPDSEGHLRFQVLSDYVEAFIDDFEAKGLHE